MQSGLQVSNLTLQLEPHTTPTNKSPHKSVKWLDRPSPSQLVLNLISTMKLLPKCHVKEIPALTPLEMILLFICFILTALSNKLRYYEMKETFELLTVQKHTWVSVLLSLKINILRAGETVLGWRHMPYRQLIPIQSDTTSTPAPQSGHGQFLVAFSHSIMPETV